MRRPDPTPVERFVFHALSLVIVALGLGQMVWILAALAGLK